MNILDRLRKIRPESFEDIYSFICDIRVEANFSYDAEKNILTVGSHVYAADEADKEKAGQLFDNLDFTNDSILHNNLEIVKTTFLAAFLAKPIITQEKRKGVNYTTDPKFKETQQEISTCLNNPAAIIKLEPVQQPPLKSEEQIKLNAAIATIGDYGLKLYHQKDEVAKAKGKILFNTAIKLRTQADDYYYHIDANKISKKVFYENLISTIDDCLLNRDILKKQRFNLQPKIHYYKALILNILKIGIYSCCNIRKYNLFFPPLKTKSESKLNELRNFLKRSISHP